MSRAMRSDGDDANRGMLTRDLPPVFRLPLLALGFAALVAGVGAGLARFGWDVQFDAAALAAWHGPLMVSGFFGTVIGLERAVALARGWAYIGPLAGTLGTVALLSGHPGLAPACLVVASGVLLAASVAVYLRQRASFTFTLALGAACWLTGNIVFAAAEDLQLALPWWLCFLVLTIAGERLELSRFAPRSPASGRTFALIIATLVFACGTGTFSAQAGWTLLGAGLLALAVWLMRYDLARRTVRQRGLTRFMAVCLLAGYAWLAAGSVLLLATDTVPGTPLWDAALHSILLGFVFSMVFGHAPVILPAVLRVRLDYTPAFYGPLALLHASVAARFIADVFGLTSLRPWAGASNALALGAFLFATVCAIACTTRRRAATVQ